MPMPMRWTIPRVMEKLSKKRDWRSLALVGISDAEVASWMIKVAPRARLTIVATWPEEGSLRPAKLEGNQRQLRRLARAYGSRLTFLEASPKEALDAVGDDRFDAVALFGVAGKEVATVGKKWADRLNPGGTLLGLDHRDEATRKAVKKLVPEHHRMGDGLWAARIGRPTPEGEERGEPDPVKSDEVEPETEPDLEPEPEADVHAPPTSSEQELSIEKRDAKTRAMAPMAKRPRGRPRKVRL